MLVEPDTQHAIDHLDNLLNDNQRLEKLITVPTLFHRTEKQHIISLAKRNVDTQCTALLNLIGQLVPKLTNQSDELQAEAMLLVEAIQNMTRYSTFEQNERLQVKLLQDNADWKPVVEEFALLKKHIQLVNNNNNQSIKRLT